VERGHSCPPVRPTTAALALSGPSCGTQRVDFGQDDTRVRKDAKFRAYLPPDQRRGARKYGPDLPTPLQSLQDPNLPWESLAVLVAGQVRTLHYKGVPGLCWPKVTRDRPMRFILIKAPGYRLRKGSKLLYREPAFLITTDLTTPAAELIAAYLARWEVEVNFRDEKTLLGVGQAQVRHPPSTADSTMKDEDYD
jgi:hypothetical protein